MTSGDDEVLRYWETNAPLSRERMTCLYLAYKAGFNTSVSVEPFLEDYSLIRHIKTIHPYVTHDIWIGPMNFTHVPKEYIEELNQEAYYTKENLIKIKKEIDSLCYGGIRYKDHFLNKINGGSK
jgi:DNA repair photolyase